MPDAPIPQRPLTARALLSGKRLSDPQIHPDGQRVAFVATEADFDESEWVSHVWLTEWPAPETEEEDASPTAEGVDVEEQTAPAEDRTRQLTFGREGETQPRWSPDGRWLAFLSSRPDPTETLDDDADDPTDQVWLLPLDGGEPRKLTSAKEGVLDFAWIENAAPALPNHPSASPPAPPLKGRGDSVEVEPFSGSPNLLEPGMSAVESPLPFRGGAGGEASEDDAEPGSILVFFTPEPRPAPIETVRKEERERRKNDPVVEQEDRLRRQWWRVDADERKPKLLHIGDVGVTEWAVSPDGTRLCWLTNRTGDPNDYHVSDLWVRDLISGVSQCLLVRPGGKYQPIWSPDGQHVAFLSWLDSALSYSRQSLYLTPVPETLDADVSPDGGSDLRPITAPDCDEDLLDFQWSRNDGAIYALAAHRTGTRVLHITPERTKALTDADAGRDDLHADPNGAGLVWVQETRDALDEVVLRDAEGGLHTLTRLNAELTANARLPRQEVVTWVSDEWTIEGVLTHPLDPTPEKPAPLILQLHGGPKGRTTNTLLDYYMASVWASEGYLVLRPNFRGSEGYGQAFAVANRRDLGGGDFRDVMAGVDWCIAQGLADPDRLGVMGGSYGGYLTNWIIGQTDRFKAAVSLFGIFHLQTDYSNSELSRWDNDYLGAPYWEDPDIYRRLSPGSYLQAIRTPTLILHGDDDPNTTLANSREMYQALRARA